MRSVERLKLIEEEIEKDYSKYQNEYGLTKTAFAKAVNTLRERSLQNKELTKYPENAERKAQNSNEKGKRIGSSNTRTNSN